MEVARVAVLARFLAFVEVSGLQFLQGLWQGPLVAKKLQDDQQLAFARLW